MNKYRFIDDIATADIAFEAYGAGYSELFENAALAVSEAMVGTSGVEPLKKRKMLLKADGVEGLLFKFLEELVFLKDAEEMVFSKFECEVAQLENGEWKMESHLSGDMINPKEHTLRDDVKAVTKHLFEVKKTDNNGYKCKVVLDV